MPSSSSRERRKQKCCTRFWTSPRLVCHVRASALRKLSKPVLVHELTGSAPGLVFWFADADAASQTTYPPTTFRWIDNQKEAEEAVEAAKRKAAKRAAEGENAEDQ